MAQRPLYGALVIGELPNEADPRTIAAKPPTAAFSPPEGFLRKKLSGWVRKLHLSRERST